MDLNKIEKTIEELELNSKKVAELGIAVKGLKKFSNSLEKVLLELKKLPSQLEKDSSLITVKILELEKSIKEENKKYINKADINNDLMNKQFENILSLLESISNNNKLNQDNILSFHAKQKLEIQNIKNLIYLIMIFIFLLGLFIYGINIGLLS